MRQARHMLTALRLAGIALGLGLAGLAAAEVRAERFLVYRVERIDPAQAPAVDGRLDEPVWRDKATLASLRNFLGPLSGEFATQPSEFILLCDGRRLYLGATFHEQSMATIRGDPAKEPFWNDCTELYFDPRHDGTRHIQLVVDCTGQRYWHKRFDEGYGWWDDSGWHLLAQWQSAVTRGDDRWTIELALDCASFGIDSTPGAVCGFNPCRFRFAVPGKDEFSAWGFDAETTRQKAMTHWGHLIFGAPGERARGVPVTRREVDLVYHDLGSRVLEVPVDDGFVVFSAAGGEQRVSFPSLLTPLAEAAEAAGSAATEAVDTLPPGNPQRQRLDGRLDDLVAELARLRQSLDRGDLTLGLCDRLAQGLRRSHESLESLTWTARIVRLAATP